MKSNRSAPSLAAMWLAAIAPFASADPAKITVAANQPTHSIPPTLWGVFFEDINLSIDGGIHAELVRNRNFQDSDQPDHWNVVAAGAATCAIAIDTTLPLSAKNPRSLKLTTTTQGARTGVSNNGYYGMGIRKDQAYKLSMWARADKDFSGPLTAALESNDGTTLATAALPALTAKWAKLDATLTAGASDRAARLVITTNRAGTFWLDMVSLSPAATWRDRGLRSDLAEMLVDLKPGFLRFPGGCWVEGDTMKDAYRWKQTIGDPSERRTQHNIWAYEATHAVGYHEYLQLSEDLGATPLFCINAGMSHKEVVPMDQMHEYVQDALDAIEYANGPATSHWGALRAKAGHPAPFHLKYLEIGNENGGPAYNERYALFVKAIKAKYPEIILIANEWGGHPPKDVEIIDEHYYNTPDFFIREAGKYDTYDRKGAKIFVGEYAVTQNAGLGNLRGAIGEAAFMTGIERNSDVVVMAAYAPLLCNANHKRWPINLINYDSTRVFGIPSYYVQKLFAQNRGDVVLPVDVQTGPATDPARTGAVGVGTWLGAAEFTDMKVTRDGKTLYAFDPAKGTAEWRRHGGNWSIQDGSLRQLSTEPNIRAFVGDPTWSDYTYSLKARKIAGQEGFLIPFLVGNEQSKCWWNLGGWGNTRHAIEMDGITANSQNGQIQSHRWYDIRIEVRANNVKCYLDKHLIHDVRLPSSQSLHVAAALDHSTREIIVKAVNAAATPVATEIHFAGVATLADAAKSIVLTSDHPTDENTLDNPAKVAPVETTLTVTGNILSPTLPGNSLTIIRIKTH